MITLSDLERARLVELRAERALRRLSPSEEKELRRLADAAGEPDDGSFERAAAAVQLAAGTRIEPLPRALASRLMRDADDWLASQSRSAAVAALGRRREPPPSWFAYGGWLAAAACGIAAVGLLLINLDAGKPATSVAGVPATDAVRAGSRDGNEAIMADPAPRSPLPAPVASPRAAVDGTLGARLAATSDSGSAPAPAGSTDATPDAARDRAALLAASRFTLRRNWISGNDPLGRGVAGDVVWDGRTQTGYLRFTGLRSNDPGREQYQLWIFDASRDERYPVDGGVFDVPRDGEVVIPIRARLPVDRPVMFAVTVERPGGVVVSDRSRLVVLARVS